MQSCTQQNSERLLSNLPVRQVVCYNEPMKKNLTIILILSLFLITAAVPAAHWGAFALENDPQAEEPLTDGNPENDYDPTQPIIPEQPAETMLPESGEEQPLEESQPEHAVQLFKAAQKTEAPQPETTTAAPEATVKTTLESVKTKYDKSYTESIKDTITVSPAYGRTVKLYFYDPYKGKWAVKKTYKTENKKTAKITISYPKLWKSYSTSKWQVYCPTYKKYKKAYKTVKISNTIVKAKAAIIMDGKTGEVLYAKNARKHLKIASMTKMVTMMVVDDKAKDKTKVTITQEAVDARKMSSGMGLVKGDVVYMKDLEHATLMESANDAAAAAACGVSGTQKKFAPLMEAKAKSLGATETTFEYAFGDWHCDTHSTAYDQALIGREFMTNSKYDNLRTIVRKESYTFKTLKKKKKYTVEMGGMSTALIKKGKSIGIKSGYNPPAGYCYANAWKYNDRLYISIVMGASSHDKLVSSQKALMKFGEYSVKHKGNRIKVK